MLFTSVFGFCRTRECGKTIRGKIRELYSLSEREETYEQRTRPAAEHILTFE